MNEADALDIVNQAIWTVIVASGPAVGAAMLAGVCIALFQALTQIQEITLTFVPKILVILAVLALTAPFVGSQINTLTLLTYSRIENGFRALSVAARDIIKPKTCSPRQCRFGLAQASALYCPGDNRRIPCSKPQ